jgi:hypothetical protein
VFRSGELGEAERLILQLNLTQVALVEFIVRLDRDRRQQRDGDKQKETW